MKYQYDTLVYIGRFQPFHNAHLATIKHALTLAKRVVVVVGSANQPRDEDNPFSQEERIHVMRRALTMEGVTFNAYEPNDSVVSFVTVENTIYNNPLWATNVAIAVEPFITSNASTKLIGHTKDESSFYLKMFPQWGAPIEMPLVEVLDATTIRQMYFSDKCNLNFFANVVPKATMEFLECFKQVENYEHIREEAAYIRNYRKQFEHLPYPPTFNTGDAVVFKDNHVLMIERKAAPGKGLLAFPGGFLNANTDADLVECAIRELFEETKIKVPEKIIRKSIVEEKVFSALKRSRRGRVITTAQFINLDDPDNPGLPKVKGSDDAKSAIWVPHHKVERVKCFEDHYDMFTYFRGRYENRAK